MPFEPLDNLSTSQPKQTVPNEGMRFVSRAAARRSDQGEPSRYIRAEIGKQLAKEMVLIGESTMLDIAFGTGEDAGMMRIGVNETSGKFLANRNKKGGYGFSINAKTAEGLFSVNFDPVTINGLEPTCESGKCPFLILKVPEALLETD